MAATLSDYADGDGFAYVVDMTAYDSDADKLDPVTDDQERELRTALAQLGFQSVEYYRDVFTSADMEKFLAYLASAIFPESTGRILVLFSGHGLEGKLYTTDLEPFTFDTIKHCFGINASLSCKLKWLMFATCRGRCESTRKSNADEPAKGASTPWYEDFQSVHMLQDMVSSFAAPDTYSTYGRTYINAFVSTVTDVSRRATKTSVKIEEFLKLLTKAEDKTRRVPTYESTLIARSLLHVSTDSRLSPSVATAQIVHGMDVLNELSKQLLTKEQEGELTEREEDLERYASAGRANIRAVRNLFKSKRE